MLMTDILNKVIKTHRPDLTLSSSAIAHLKKQVSKNMQAKGVRLLLNKTGCSGLSYVFDLIEKEEESDRKFTFDDLTVYIENKSFPYLKGVGIDFVKEGLNNKYVYDNPNQTGACGCGESFTIE